jgi:hypothetical protein
LECQRSAAMFARIKRVGVYAYLQLVRRERCGGRPRQRVLATLGRVEQLQHGGELDGLLRSLSQYSPQALALVCGQSQPATRNWKLGPALVFERLWQRVGLGEILNGLLAGRGFEFAVERAIFVTVLHRLCVSGSDRQAERWRQGYWLPGTEGLALHHWYRAMAWLGEGLAGGSSGTQCFGPRCVKDQVEEALFARRRDLFSALSVVFFDTTSLYFEGQGGESLGRRGKSKDHRPDLRQMVVGVVLDQEGQPLCSHLWPGNTADVKSLVPVVKDLQQRFGVGRICVVADRGMISAQTMRQLEELGWEYILGARMRSQSEVRDQVVGSLREVPEGFALVHPERVCAKDPSPLAVKEVWEGAHRYVVCYNAEQARKDAHDRQAIVSGLRQALRAGDKRLVGNRGYRRYLKSAGHHFEVDEAKLQSEARYDGLWVLRTHADLVTAAVALRYKELWRVERLFRDAKSLLRTRPIYHKLDETIRGHVFCSFLALVLLRELDRCLEEAGVEAEWNDVLRDLKALQRMELQEGDKRLWIRSQVQGCCAAVFRAAGLALPSVLQLADSPPTHA